jgi:hypothetical protein
MRMDWRRAVNMCALVFQEGDAEQVAQAGAELGRRAWRLAGAVRTP